MVADGMEDSNKVQLAQKASAKYDREMRAGWFRTSCGGNKPQHKVGKSKATT